ncbi:MAG: FliM/FliN family flagellar motor switch protein, partial [Rhodospirillales bacterium]|nr:FliM/FliN family flagellar motor switch protein [Rhodospirillales bacterium]
DAMCGATAAHPFERYELSALETRIGRQMVDLAFTTISETFTPILPLSLSAIAYENATGMLAIADGQDWMIAVTGIFETDLGSGTIRLIVPYSAFETLEAKIVNQSGLLGGRGPDVNWTGGVDQLTDSTKIELRFEVARAKLPLVVFQALRPGDLLPVTLLPHAVAIGGGVDLFLADYGQQDGHVCCRVKAEDEGETTMVEQRERLTGAEKLIEPERVELERLQAQPRGAAAITAKVVLDRVQVAVAVELGRTQISVKDLRALRHGQILQLDQVIGEPLAIFANGQKLAYGEVVAVANDRYGVRVTALAEDAVKEEEEVTS